MFLFAGGLKVYLSQTEKSCAHTPVRSIEHASATCNIKKLEPEI